MNHFCKRLDALEAVAVESMRDARGVIILRELVTPGARDGELNFITSNGKLFERTNKEAELEFLSRVRHEIAATYGSGRVHRLVGSGRMRK